MDIDEVVIKLQRSKNYMDTGAGNLSRWFKCSKQTIYDAKDIVRGKLIQKVKPGPRILIFDIENAPMVVYAFSRWKQNISLNQTISESFLISWSAKWFMSTETMSDCITPEEALARDDSRIVKSLWELFDKADILVAHNACMTKGHKVLKKDFVWENVENLKIGDELFAFDEDFRGDGIPRKYNTSIVTASNIVLKDCVKITLENGETLTCSKDHPFLTRHSKRYRHWDWYKASELSITNKLGSCLTKVLTVSEETQHYHAGYLAAFFDADGCLNQTIRKDRINGYLFSCTFSQKDPHIIDKLKESLDFFGFKYSVRSYDRAHRDIKHIRILGGLSEQMRFLTICNPQKKNRIDYSKISQMKMSGIEDYSIVSIEDVGIQEVVQLSTSTHTYICNGFPMHNCNFDIPKANSRFIVHGLEPPSSYQVIDTLTIAKKQFGFSSNKLDALAGYFNIKTKLDTDFTLWAKCMDGDRDALNYMLKYNILDSEILEEVYIKLRPWVKAHPNSALYYNDNEQRCCNCGSSNVVKLDDKFYYTSVGKYEVYRCECGALSRGRKTVIDKTKNSITLTSVGK